LLTSHENTISNALGMATVQEKLFNDYSGKVKSLGAWGGDFILATNENDPTEYFKEKGYETIIPFSEMVLP
ncbi:MAG: GHMP kinase, partial [Flavobacteriaceae bacterium]